MVKYGARFVYVVDRGWVEVKTGQGSLSRGAILASLASSINMGAVPLILLVGFVSRVMLLVL